MNENKFADFFENPQKYIPIDSIGDMYLQLFYNKYAVLRMKNSLPILEKAYELLKLNNKTSSSNSFEMDSNSKIWIEFHDEKKIIVEEKQSNKFIYIFDKVNIHIRELECENIYPPYLKIKLKGNTLDKFKKINFNKDNKKRFEGFYYGDERDRGYILSCTIIDGSKLIGNDSMSIYHTDFANNKTINVISNLSLWVNYLDNIEEYL